MEDGICPVSWLFWTDIQRRLRSDPNLEGRVPVNELFSTAISSMYKNHG